MSYIGNTPTSQSFISGTDYFNGNGSTTAFTLTRTVGSVNDIEAVVENVVQRPNDAYTISGTTITFTSAPPSGTNNIYVRYLSTTTQSITPVQNSVSYATMNTDLQNQWGTGFKNRIINGDMRIDQRNAGAAVTSSGSYPVDRFSVVNVTDGAFSAQQDSSAPTGFINSIKCTTTTADASLGTDQRYFVRQAIEGTNIADLGWGTANAKTVTLSFWVRSSLTGTFGGVLRNSASNRSYPFTYSISAANTWEQKSVTIAGDTSGTWLTTTGVGILVVFGLGVASNLSGTAGAWAGAEYLSATGATSVIGTLNATWYITGVQIEVGSTATPFEVRPYGAELQLCQRYYYKAAITNAGSFFGTGVAYSTTSANVFVPFPVPLRTRPTALSQSGTAGDYRVFRQGTNVTCSAVPTFDEGDTFAANVSFPVASGLTAGEAIMGRSVNTSAFLAWSAEL